MAYSLTREDLGRKQCRPGGKAIDRSELVASSAGTIPAGRGNGPRPNSHRAVTPDRADPKPPFEKMLHAAIEWILERRWACGVVAYAVAADKSGVGDCDAHIADVYYGLLERALSTYVGGDADSEQRNNNSADKTVHVHLAAANAPVRADGIDRSFKASTIGRLNESRNIAD